jgi:hypothetical protein
MYLTTLSFGDVWLISLDLFHLNINRPNCVCTLVFPKGSLKQKSAKYWLLKLNQTISPRECLFVYIERSNFIPKLVLLVRPRKCFWYQLKSISPNQRGERNEY